MSDYDDDYGGSDYNRSRPPQRKKTSTIRRSPTKKRRIGRTGGGTVDDDFIEENFNDYDSDCGSDDSGDD